MTEPNFIYPVDLAKAERDLIRARRGLPRDPAAPVKHRVGVALSGGGIRSATFSLGFFQALARAKLLRHVDLLSTVSGGGYFGGFFAGLFTRNGIANSAQEVEDILTGKQQPDVLDYLRENGRYLAPGGNDDLLLAGAVLLRAWVALQLVLWTFALLGFLMIHVFGVYYLDQVNLGSGEWALASLQMWLSPCVWIGLIVLIGGAIPLGAGYWMIGPYGTPWLFNQRHALNALIAGLLPLSVGLLRASYAGTAKAAAWSLPLAGGATMLTIVFAMRFAAMSTWRRAWTLPFAGAVLAWFGSSLLSGGSPGARPDGTLALIATLCCAIGLIGWAATSALRKDSDNADDVTNHALHNISDWLKAALIISAVLLTIGLFDSAGRTLYWYLAANPMTRFAFAGSVAALFSGIASLAAFAQRLGALLPNKPDGQRPGWLLGAAARAAAVIVLSVGLSICATFAAAIAAGFTAPCNAYIAQLSGAACPSWDHSPLLIGTAAAFALSLLFAFARVFINRSSHHALYSARLTRAYLGASNPRRLQAARNELSDRSAGLPGLLKDTHALPDVSAATLVMPGDDILPGSYWEWPPESAPKDRQTAPRDPYSCGAPLHLINVTINETVDGRSRTQQADRKGVGMALGPCGLSVGASHHALFRWRDQGGDPKPRYLEGGYRVFSADGDAEFPAEPLTIGAWLGISGAAFSTGLGFRTNFGMSILAGLANIRLGYWWKPGVTRAATLKRFVGAIFWVQSYLLRELLARFPGTANALWYLSDGGHFENLGAYELIRRRTEFMLLVDAEADADYQFESLGNLVRKARIDFNAEIEFLPNGPELADYIHPDMLDRFGNLEQFRRGEWVKGLMRTPPPEVVADKAWELKTPEREKLSLATAALARVTYADDPQKVCWLMYVKPTLNGNEPVDVRRYHTEHPDFPHESTIDQFFDEAQWESYRMLGEHIGAMLFPEDEKKSEARKEPRTFFTGQHLGFGENRAVPSTRPVVGQGDVSYPLDLPPEDR